MPSLVLAVDCFGITHLVSPWHYEAGELLTECGVVARWKDLTFWWSPVVMTRTSPDDPITCMTCLVSES